MRDTVQPLQIQPEPLTAATFRPFGRVIEAAEAAQNYLINEGTTRRFHNLATLDAEGGTAIVSIFRGTPRPQPIALRMLERHPLGSQSFIPLSREPWLVAVASSEDPGLADIRVFRARGDQGVHYARNTWHHPLLVLVARQDFLVLDRAGPGDNLEELWFPDGATAQIAVTAL